MENYRADDLRIYRFGENATTGCYIVDQFSQRGSFHFFAFQVGNWIEEIKTQTALAQLADKQFLLLGRWNI